MNAQEWRCAPCRTHPIWLHQLTSAIGLKLILPGRVECPRWHDAYQAGIGDLLTAVLCDVLNGIELDAPFGNLPSVPLQSLFQVRVRHGADGRLGVSVGSLERSDDFSFVGGGLLKGFRVDPAAVGVPTSL
jgi:hypothetical protein